ncbi:hypothetical protein HOLleu_38501 [Holothuria leucospilota]|uniref:TNFR-Cys domain-containing protein n=1 Tax=Holothuria leucospilota TaxID=206669 RepID=A0A9Q1BDF0_HOLLE|nr:hypothetical protein HOLleu_38501 [Holothuria leucospilota]
MAYKFAVIAVVLSLQFLLVELPALTEPPSPTDDSNRLYVASEKENELCFYEPGKPIPEGLYVRCGPGYHAQIDDRLSPCHLCTHDETLKTYQPKVNHCEKCILCTDCSALGKEVEKNCTLTTDTVCKDATPQISDDAFTTDPNVQYSSSHSPSLGVSTTTSQTLPRNETDPPDCPSCQLEEEIRNLRSQLEEENPQNNGDIVQNNIRIAEADNEGIVPNHTPPAEADNGPRSTEPLLPDNGPRSADSLLLDNGPRSTDPLLPDNEDTSFNYTTEAEVHNGDTNQPDHEEESQDDNTARRNNGSVETAV